MSFDMPPASAGFAVRGRWLIDHYSADLEISETQAAGPVGNFGFESGGLVKLHEGGQPAELGGIGWPQWTGHNPGGRRYKFEQWCQAQGLPWYSDEANYGYTLVELRGDYKYCVDALRHTSTVEDAVFSFGQTYERPGGTTPDYLPGFSGRLAYAKQALAGGDSRVQVPAVSPVLSGLPRPAIILLQEALKARALYASGVDGIFGPRSQRAYDAYVRGESA